jgi:hypothetical protein
MYQALATAVLLAATVLPLCLEGQMRATQRPGIPARISVGSPFRSIRPRPNGFVVNSGGRFIHRSGFGAAVGLRHRRRFGIFIGNACFNGAFFDPSFCRQFFFRNRFFFAQPLFLPYPVYASSPDYQVAEQSPTTTSDQETELSREVDRLSDEIERLREEEQSRAAAQQAASQPRSSADEKMAATILVFRDGHRNEIQNYAIVGRHFGCSRNYGHGRCRCPMSTWKRQGS